MKSCVGAILIVFIVQTSGFVPTSTTAPSPPASCLSLSVDDKTEVREYFNTEGFNRWNKIYSESDDVNSVQLDIRTGHDQTIQKVLNWISDDGDIGGKTVCDCGCGVGSLAIPLAQMGKQDKNKEEQRQAVEANRGNSFKKDTLSFVVVLMHVLYCLSDSTMIKFVFNMII